MRRHDRLKDHDRLQRLRNIGVLAHVDAGKTTLTERMLFAAGRIHQMGEVHHGASAMDHREVEQRHGVTVSAAATTVDWRAHAINVLDTPGHVDFTQEVERALLAIDGAVVLFSAVSGVEPQTETVWRQADRFALPRLGFVNKMDALGADLPGVLEAMRMRLGARPAALQWPMLDDDGALTGVLDLVEGRWLSWPDDRTSAEMRAVSAPIPGFAQALADEKRALLSETVIDALSAVEELEDETLEMFLAGRWFSAKVLRGLVRRACLRRVVTPVLCGAAYREIGVAELLDALVDLLPSPADRGEVTGVDPSGAEIRRAPSIEAPASALVSKVAVTRFGPMATLRVMSGQIAPGARLLNVSSGETERVGRVLALHAGETEKLGGAFAGDIVAVMGLKSAQAGDSLADPTAPIAFAGTSRPEPVIEAAVEPLSQADQQKLGPALAALTREDPSLQVKTDPETGQLLLSGMGELHLQIALEALQSERGVAARIGPPRIAYREAIRRAAEVRHTLSKQTGGPGMFARLTLRLEPVEAGAAGLVFEDRTVGGALRSENAAAVRTALEAALQEGPLAGYPVVGLRALVLDAQEHPVDSSQAAFALAARGAFREAYAQADPQLLEPLARIDISAPEEHVGGVIADLQSRGGQVMDVVADAAAHRVLAEAPMARLWGYAGALRSLTRGRGQASVAPSRYAPVSAAEQAALLSGAEDGA